MVAALTAAALLGLAIGWAWGRWTDQDSWRAPLSRYTLVDEREWTRLKAYRALIPTPAPDPPAHCRVVKIEAPRALVRRGLPKEDA